MTVEELDALEARITTIDNEVWTILGGKANVTMGHIKALRAAAPSLIASARALESLRTAVAEYRVVLASIADADPWDDGANCRWEKAAGRLADATLALFPEET